MSPFGNALIHLSMLSCMGGGGGHGASNRPCSIYLYSNMAPRLSGQTSIFDVFSL